MGMVAFLIAVLYVCLGFAAGTFLSRRGAATVAAKAEPPEDDKEFNIRGDQAAEFLDRIHKLTSNVDSGVDRHATRVAEISGGLSGEQRVTVAVAEAAAAQLLEANHQLQNDLATAKEELQSQRRLLDSYNWSLMRLLRDQPGFRFDYIFLDGAHTWAHDALAFLLLDRMLAPGGHIDFDDYDWSIAHSPSMNPKRFPKASEWFSDEQIETCQVKLVVDLLVRPSGYEEVIENKVFRKVARDRL